MGEAFKRTMSELAVLLLCNGMTGSQLAESVAELKNSSKSCGTHRQREFWWQAYGKIVTCCSGREGEQYGFVTYRTNKVVKDGAAGEDDEIDAREGEVDFVPFTGKQKQMLAGSVEILGKKFKPPEEEGQAAKHWYSCYWGEEAQAALDDITSAEAAIYCTTDGIFVGTRLKRKKCKGGSTIKTVKEFEKFVSELLPGDPLQSINWRGANEPPRVNPYNLILAGSGWNSTVLDNKPEEIGFINTTSVDEIYNLFLLRRNEHLMSQADFLIDQMLTDAAKEKEAFPRIVAGAMKEAAAARKSSLIKKVFVHESKKQFVKGVREEGDVDMVLIEGDISGTKFGDYGGIVFEMHYRANLADYMY